MEMAAANVTTSNNEVQTEAIDSEGSRPASPKAPVRKHRAKLECVELAKKSDVSPNKSDNLQTVIIISRVITDNSRVTAEMSTVKPESSPETAEAPKVETHAAVIQESTPVIIIEDFSVNTDQKQAEPDDDRGKEDTKEIIPVKVDEIKTTSPKLPQKTKTIQPDEVKITPPKVKDGKSQVKVINAAVKVFNKLMPSKKSTKIKPHASNENIADTKISDDKEVNLNDGKINEENKADKAKQIGSDEVIKVNGDVISKELNGISYSEEIKSIEEIKTIEPTQINSDIVGEVREEIKIQDLSQISFDANIKVNDEIKVNESTPAINSHTVIKINGEIKESTEVNAQDLTLICPNTEIKETEEIKAQDSIPISPEIEINKIEANNSNQISSESEIKINEEIKAEASISSDIEIKAAVEKINNEKENEQNKADELNCNKDVKLKNETLQTKIPQVKSKISQQVKTNDTKVESKDISTSKKGPSVFNRLAKVVDDVKKQYTKEDTQPSKIASLSQKKKSAEESKSQQVVVKDDKVATGANKINHPKVESDATLLKKLRVSTEQLNQENASLKKVLESERSAFREHKALHEAEMRKERAEAKRREGALEGQLRSALKGVPPPSHGDGSAQADAAKLVSALQAVKSANKNLQDKLQVVTEADKRKVSEIRAQHDAHATQLLQMEREARAQTVKLLEELKTKERQLEQVKRGARGVPPGGGLPKLPVKMAVADQLLAMEDQISRLENELMRRDDIIRSLRNSRGKRLPISRRASKENLLKDTISDVDSAVSSAPNSLSPQPSPDLWFHSQEAARKEVDESLLDVQRKQIHELEKALNLSSVGQRTAQLRATQLEEQLQDLREHADLLEFRCLELEDTSEKRNSLEELTDSDSGCTSPEDRLKNSVSPQLRRSDSGYKSPTHQPTSPSLKNRRILSTPIASLSESESAPYTGKTHLQVNEHNQESGQQSDDIRDRLERMLAKTHTETDRNCLEQVLQLLWNLQALSSNLSDEDYSMTKNKKTIDNDTVKNDFEQTKTSKIIATISPYSQTSHHKIADVTKSVSVDEPDLLNILIKEESKRLLYGLQESGIFDETDWDNKSTQTDWCDCVYTEPQSDLATEVQRLNQIREQLEKSGAIRSKSFNHKKLDGEIFMECNQPDSKQHRKLIDFYEKRNSILESKISIYESSEEVKEKKLAQRLQMEIDLQAKVELLESDLDELQRKYVILEEERCEIEEEENDTRLHCQELEAEFELLSAKLRDMDEQRTCAKNEAECYRELVQEYEDKSICMMEQEKDLRERLQIMEKTVPALIFWNICKLIDQYPEFDFKAAYQARFGKMPLMRCEGGSDKSQDSKSSRMIVSSERKDKDSGCDPLACIETQLQLMDGEKKVMQKRCKEQEDILRKRMAKLERIIVESKETCKIQEEEANNRIKSLERELSIVREKSSTSRERNDTQACTSDAECTKKLQALIAKERELKYQIEELQKKEAAYINTLNQGDEMWAEIEQHNKLKMKEYEDNEATLKDKIHKCESDRNRWKGICELLEQKVRELEESETDLESGIKKLQDESQSLITLNAELSKHAENLKLQLNQSKAQSKFDLEALKSELSIAKKLSEDVQTELKVQRSIQVDMESSHSARIIQMRKEISKSSKDLLDLDVTNGELKEEVDTLENQVTQLSDELTKQRKETEEKIKSLLGELSNKSKEVDELEREIADYQHLPSAHEELQQFDKSTSFESGFNHTMCTCKSLSKQQINEIIIEDDLCDHLCRCHSEKLSVQKSDKSVMTDATVETADRRSPSKNDASIPKTSIQSAQSSEGQSRQKPELPKRKPKVTPKPHPSLRNEEHKKNSLQRTSNKVTKPSKESVKILSKELTGSLLNVIDLKENNDLETSIFKTIHDSLDVYLDNSTQPSSQEEDPNVSSESDKNMHLRKTNTSEETLSPHVQESVKLFERACDNPNKPGRLGTPPLQSNNHDDAEVQKKSPDSPVLMSNNNSFSYKIKIPISEINFEPQLAEKHEILHHSSSSAKDLISNFNSINTNSKPNGLAAEPMRYFVQNPAKPLGGLVFDRVAKLTSGLINSNSSVGLKRSVSMTDSKTLPAKSLYIYTDC